MTATAILRDYPAEQYHTDPALSAGRVIAAQRATWLHAMQGYGEADAPAPTTAMTHGGAWHAWELEPAELARAYYVIPEAPDDLSKNSDGSVSKRSKAGKAWWADVEAEAAGRRIVDPGMYASILAMTEAAHAHPLLGPMLRSRTDAELSMWWTDEVSGVRCKARADVVCAGTGLLVDLKRTDPHPGAFARSAGRMRYDLRAAWYLDAAAACGLPCDEYLYACVEPTPPYAVSVYRMDDADIDAARWTIDRLLAEYVTYSTAGAWPSYPPEVRTISMPAWARRSDERDD